MNQPSKNFKGTKQFGDQEPKMLFPHQRKQKS